MRAASMLSLGAEWLEGTPPRVNLVFCCDLMHWAHLTWFPPPPPPFLNLPLLGVDDRPDNNTTQLKKVYLLWGKGRPGVFAGLDDEFLKDLRRLWNDTKQRTKRSSLSHAEVSKVRTTPTYIIRPGICMHIADYTRILLCSAAMLHTYNIYYLCWCVYICVYIPYI